MKRICVEGKQGESVCGRGQHPLRPIENATCPDCLRRCVQSERQFQEVQERVMTDDRKEIARLREENAMLLEQHKSACIAVRKLAPEVTRLLEAIKRWSIAVKTTPLKSTMEQETECFQAARDLHEIAREGR